MKRRLPLALALGAAFAALWFAVDSVREWRDRAWIEARIEALRALGEPTTLEELEGPPVPDEENAFTALETIAAEISAEQRDESRRFPSRSGGGSSLLRQVQIEECLSAHPERSSAISSALQRKRYRAPRGSTSTPLDIAKWLEFEVLAETMRDEPRASLRRALADLVELASLPPIIQPEDALMRLMLHSVASLALGDALEHPRVDADMVEPLLMRLAAHCPVLDPVLVVRAQRVALLQSSSRGQSTEIRSAIEDLDELELEIRAGAKPEELADFYELVCGAIDKTIARDHFLGIALAARRFEASERRWPQSLKELETRLPAGWSVPQGVVLEATEQGLRLITPLPPGRADEPYELLLRRAR
ncbi:MAG: hypothetical protein JNM84_03360 [Planctomycetes bacterium]|nr:hypothetical protein [Planctomycetota bacterium]